MAPRSDPRQRGAVKPPKAGEAVTKEDKQLQAVADWLRNEKKSGLQVREAVQYEKRVEYFKGAKLVDAFVGTDTRPPALKTLGVGNRLRLELAAATNVETGAEPGAVADERALTRAGDCERRFGEVPSYCRSETPFF